MRSLICSTLAAIGIFSHASAQQWQQVTVANAAGAFFTHVSFISREVGFISGWQPGGTSVFSKTTDGGKAWATQSVAGTQLYTGTFIDENKGFVAGYAQDCQCGVLYATTNGGQQWTFGTHAAARGFYTMAFPTPQTGYIAGDQGAMLKTTDGGSSWQELPIANSAYAYSDLSFPTPEIGYAVVASNARARVVLKTTDGGTSWKVLKNYTSEYVLGGVYFVTPMRGFLVGSNGSEAIYMTTDGGETWNQQYLADAPSDRVLNKVVFSDADHGYAVGQEGMIIRTTNGGNNWQMDYQTGSSLEDVAYAGDSTIYAVGDFGAAFRKVEKKASVSPVASVDVQSIEFGGIRQGQTATRSFTIAAGNSAELIVNSIAFDDPQAQAKGFVISSPASETFPAHITSPDQLAVSVGYTPQVLGDASTWLVVSTNDPLHATIRIPVTAQSVASVGREDIARAQSLHMEMFPNPMPATGEISWYQPAAARTSVELFDAAGRRVAVLYEGMKEQGMQRLAIDMRMLPAGTYHCRIGAGEIRESMTISVVR